MKTLRRGKNQINVLTIAKKIDFKNDCEARYFTSFVRYVQENELISITALDIDKDTYLWKDWLQNKVSVQEWLITNKFAEWEKPVFEPFDLRIETLNEAELLWQKLNEVNKIGTADNFFQNPLCDVWRRLDTIMKRRN